MLRFLIGGCLLILVAVLAHFSGLGGTWVFDDIPRILENPRVHRTFRAGDLVLPRWVAFFTLQLNYQIGGTNPFAYHLVNIGIHALAAVALWNVLRELFVHRREYWPAAIANRAEGLALMIAALWAAHPITSQAVAYVIQRAESMWSLAFLVGFYLYLRGSRIGDATISSDGASRRGLFRSPLFWSIPCFWLGMACKEPIAATLFALPICDRIFGQFGWRTWWKRRRVYYAVLFAPLLLALPLIASRLLNQSSTSSGGFFAKTITPIEYWTTQPEAILIYVTRVLVPVGFCFDYLWPPQNNAVILMIESALLISALAITARSVLRGRAWSLFPALFFLSLSTTCLVPLIDLVVEHRMYLATAWLIAGLTICVVLAGDALQKRFTANRRLAMDRILTAIAVVCLAGLMFACFQRSRIYQSSLALWKDTVRKADWNYRAHINYANELLQVGQSETAANHCRTAISKDSLQRQPPYQQAKAYDALAVALSQHGDVDGAIKAAKQAVALTPGGSDHLLRLASVHAEHRQWNGAIEALQRAIKNRPPKPVLYQKLGLLLTRIESWDAARQAYATASKLSGRPDHSSIPLAQIDWMLGQRENAEAVLDAIADTADRNRAWSGLADWLARSDRWEEYRHAAAKAGKSGSPQSLRQQFQALVVTADYATAEAIAERALAASTNLSDRVTWSVELATLRFRQGDQQPALETLARLSDQHPESPRVWRGLGDVNRWMGRRAEAIVAYEKAVRLGDEQSSTLNNLGSLISPQDPGRAEEYLRLAVQLDPGNHQAWHSLGNTLVRQDRLNEAVDCYQRALEIKPGFVPSRQTLQKLNSLDVTESQ